MMCGGGSLRGRIRTVILLTSITVLLVNAIAFLIYEVVSLRAQMVRNLSTLAAVIADNCAAPLAFNVPATAQEILAALKAEPDIVSAVLYASDQSVFAQFPDSLPPSQMTPPDAAGYRFESGALLLFQPVLQEGKSIGLLSMHASLRSIFDRAWNYGIIATVILAAAILLAFVLSDILQRRISNPIFALTTGANRISTRGDYSIRVPKLTNDELGAFTDSFNAMVAQIQSDQDRLREQANLLNLSHDAIIVRDTRGLITFWSRGAVEMYGFSESEALGKAARDLLHTVFPAEGQDPNDHVLQTGRWDGELRHTRKDGSKMFVASRWSLVRNSDGSPKAVLQSNTDITQKIQFQEELERLVQERTVKLRETVGELEAFSYSVSHDMRSPLRAMHGYARVLLADYKGRLDEVAIKYLERIMRAAIRLDVLVQDILAYSKVAKSEFTLQPIDLEQLLTDLLATRPELQPPSATVTFISPLHKVFAHEAYLTQCFTNLLGNAVKFVPPGVHPQVAIRGEMHDNHILVWIEDNGIGIDPSHQDRIFEIFGRVHPDKAYSGTGIGLAIVKKAVQRMNGEVGVISEVGKGSRFWLKLRRSES